MSLRLKFNLVMVASFMAGLMLAAVFVNALSRKIARESVMSEAAIMMATANATLHYTEDQVAPLLARQLKVQFLPQAIPFYSAQQSFNRLSLEKPDYTLRQPALNPTNPNDRPAAWENDIIRTFQADPSLQTLTTERGTDTGGVISFSQPVRATSESCLSCHSTPQAAPPSMIDVYGSTNGFGWKVGDTVGAQVVSVPVQVPLARARQSLYSTMAALAAVFGVMLVVLNLLLHRLIIGPVRRISLTADEVSLGNLLVPEFAPSSKDEIGSLALSFNRMRRSLVAAFSLLEDQGP